MGSITLLAFIGATFLSTLLLDNEKAKLKVQTVIKAIATVKVDKPPDEFVDKFRVELELDRAIESFFKRIIQTFISSWYSTITQDESFNWNVKVEISEAIRQIALRIQKVRKTRIFFNAALVHQVRLQFQIDHPRLLSNKLLPVVYSHIDILDRIIQEGKSHEDQIHSFISNENTVHPAVFSRTSELQYLRYLSKSLVRILATRKNYDCKIFRDLVKEILACSVLLPLTDVISDPATINLLVILATNPKVQPKPSAKDPKVKKVVLLENFVKQFRVNLYDESDDDDDHHIDGNFLKDQEKLYTFMQHLKNKSNTDIDLLKFYLDVEHLNSELEKSSVITDPVALSLLQQKSEKLLKFYQCQLFPEYNDEPKPDDLLKAHDHARKILEEKWRNDFYKR